jgi:hypothetical protein
VPSALAPDFSHARAGATVDREVCPRNGLEAAAEPVNTHSCFQADSMSLPTLRPLHEWLPGVVSQCRLSVYLRMQDTLRKRR